MNVAAVFEDLFERVPTLSSVRSQIIATYELIADAYDRGKTLFVCGNGGSAADAEHIVGELMKSFRLARPLKETTRKALKEGHDRELGQSMAEGLEGGLPAIALGESRSLATAFANDVDANLVFAQQLHGLGDAGDVLLAISTSGTASSVQAALQLAKAIGVRSAGLTGGTGGVFPDLCDVTIIVPESETYLVQELHLPVYHAICAALELRFFGSGPREQQG